MRYKKQKDGAGLSDPAFFKNKKHLKCFLLAIMIAFSFVPAEAQTCNAGTYNGGGGYCTPCQVNRSCSGGSNNSACSGMSYASTRSSSCISYTTGTVVAGKLYTCPSDTYSNSGTCTNCPNGSSCNGNTQTAWSTGSTQQISTDGQCYTCPSGFVCNSNFSMNSASPASAGNYVTSNSQTTCQNMYSWVNGIRTACATGTWAESGSTDCSYCPPNHICNPTPTSCPNGQFLATLTSTSWSNCNAGYFCRKDWIDQVKVYPGQFATGSSTNPTEWPAGRSCSDTANSADCGTYTYSGNGEYGCYAAPTFLRFSSSLTRSPQGMQSISKGYKQYPTNDDSQISCGTTDYCPGLDGGAYPEYSGLNINVAAIDPKAPGDSCLTNQYSNGGITWGACSEGASDRSQCKNVLNVDIKTQFAESFYNRNNQREGVNIDCLDSSDVRGAYNAGTIATAESGNLGETWAIEGSKTGVFPPAQWDGIRGPDNNTKLGGVKVKHTVSHYHFCSWCPDNLNWVYHNSYFPFFGGFLLECPFGEYSPNGDLDCHRKPADLFCKEGFYRAVLGSEKDDQWIHDQDKKYECLPFNKSPSTNYVALDSTKTPNWGVGDWVRYGIEGCQANSPGFYNDANSYTEAATKCTNAYFCKSERVKDELKTSQFSCPKGSVGMTDGARSEFYQCDLCREGNYCVEGTSVSSQVTCLQGYFCPPGTSEKFQFSCGAGFYGSGTGGKTFADKCTTCPTAKYCEQSSTATTDCPNGYYCFLYTDDKNKYPVMPGKFIGTATGTLAGATDCPQGKYCPLASGAAIDCPTGTYTASTGMGELLNCGPCPAGKACPTAGTSSSLVDCSKGHYCPAGTKNPYDYACPPGTFSDAVNNKASADCTDCPAGKAWLEMSTTTAQTITMTSGSKTTNAVKDCAAGHYCPVRTEFPTQFPCPVGTFTTQTNLAAASACTQCPAGKWCPAGSANSSTDCPKNFYCPAGTTSPIPCPAGKKSAAGQSVCSDCGAGHICPMYSENDNPIPCPAGYYMESTTSAGPCDLVPEGYYSTGTGAKISCGDGKWAPPGGTAATVCTDCPVGYYCASGVKTPCGTGKWCAAGSSAPANCAEGFYCPDAATTLQLVCPAGTYSAAGAAICSNAPGGYYTSQGGKDSEKTNTKCDRGYYCPGGSIGPIDQTCDTNKYTLAATVAQSVSDCTPCPAGSYCLRGVSDPIACPEGYYCPASEPYPVACEKGSFRATTGAALITDCTPCTAGKVCSQTGLTAPDKDCDAGFYCPEGTVFSRTTEPACATAGWDLTSSKVLPVGKKRAVECPAGHYCEVGSATPTPWPAGKYNTVPGQRTAAACLNCPAGKYCSGTANTAPTGDCTAGYYWVAGSSSQTQAASALGYFSVAGAASQTKCYPGEYQDQTGQSSCKQCVMGNYCPGFGNQAMTVCPAGSYCPASSNKPTPCPPGTFSASTGLQKVEDCTPCTAGKYCQGSGLTAVTGDCDAGYYCKSFAISKMPSEDTSTAVEADKKFGPCITGHYCPQGTGVPNPCPAGKYNDALMASALADCKPCLPGKYCDGTGNKVPDGDCDPGYYCPGGDSTKTPTTKCAAGEYCPAGASLNTKCPAGTYTGSAELAACVDCPEGKFWVAGTSVPQDCPAGYYCPLKTQFGTQFPCPKGKYNKLTGKKQESECLVCPAGSVCEFSGTSDETATKCQAGYYCLQGSTYEIPESSTYGGMCAPGEFCPLGSGTAQPCTGGKYCEKYLLAAVSGDWDAGYYCTAIGAKSKVIPDNYASNRGAICPIGKFCIAGTQTPADWPIGTYSASTGLTATGDCYQCPAGFFWDTLGLTDYSSKICPAGYFCPKGSTSGTTNQCPKGYMCPAGSGDKVIWDGGTYQDTVGQSTCKTCQKGNYCPFTDGTGLEAQVTCPKGYKWAETGMTAPAACLKGWYQDLTGQEDCKSCPAGSYCDRQGLLAVSATCPAGFYCPVNHVNKHEFMCLAGYACAAGSSSATPCPKGKFCHQSMLGTSGSDCLAGYYCDEFQTNQPNPAGKTCPRGSYCAAGSINPVKCAIGKYNNRLGASTVAECLDCPQGKICDELGLVEPKSNCPATKYCTGGSTQNDCTKGHYCPAGYDYQIKCQPGTYQDETAKATCKDCPEGFYCDGDLSGNNYQPLKCPPGYYCPAKTAHFHLNPCPIGKIGAATATAFGLKAIGECTSCEVKKYWDRRGLSAPTGSCKDGYLCSEGSIYPTGLNKQECPQGHYCTAGTQTACTAGTYNTETAATSVADCITWEHGKICTTTISSKADCPAGKTWGEGLSNVSGAVDCIKGHYCPTGSFQGIKCAHGTYQDETGKTTCKTCSAGKICNDLALEVETNCPAFRTWPAGSIRGRRCNPGEYIATASNTCTTCLAGKYCWPLPKAAPDNGEQGACSNGYVCQGGSAFQKPLASLATIVAGSAEFSTYNGPAFPGYFSTNGQTNTPCTAGNFQPSAFATACVPCREGHYCPTTAMSSLANYRCSGGYTCATGQTTATPAATICPINTFCEPGSVVAQRCADGYKNPTLTGQESCKECGEKNYCYQTGTPGSYVENIKTCPTSNTQCSSEILKRELKCQDGYYLNTGTSTCTICPAQKYCRGGHISGNCVAGYICNVDASSPISVPNPINRQWPINQYCKEAATAGVTCGSGTFNGNLGAISAQECLPCEPGYTCKSDASGTKVTACPLGFYCPEYNLVTNTQEDPKPCPIYTYSSVEKLFLPEMCLTCPAGTNCDATGITEYQLYKCPIGYYCLPNSLNDLTNSHYKSLHKCPLGTYGAKNSLVAKDGCTICPPGKYCDPAISSTVPTSCTDGNYCPEGSELQITCAGGQYCNGVTNYQQVDCPVNYRCESGTGTPTRCAAGVICPVRSLRGTKCNKGYEVKQVNGADTCIACAKGYYNTDAAEACKLCPAGYLCLGELTTVPANSKGGTNSATPTDKDKHRGEICPKGYYCPLGSFAPTPCPVGKYNEFTGMKSEDDCLVCPANTYNDLTAQTGCQPCGEFAYSLTGAQTCTCYGAYRTFGKSDSSCRCIPRYVFRKPDKTIERNNVSKEDCIPLTYARCDNNAEGRALDGTCKPVETTDCKTECATGGVFDKVTGKCTWNTTPTTADEVCNSACRSSASSVTVAKDGKIYFKSLTVLSQEIILGGDSNAIGTLSCANEDGCKVSQITNSNGVFQGKYGTNDYIKNKVRRLLNDLDDTSKPPKSYWEFERKFRNLATVNADTATISNPVVCLENGNSIMFEIKNYDNYPVYDENNILNSNAAFDYGPFIDLASQIRAKRLSGQSGTTNPVIFSYTFTEGGTYVFTDATITTNQMVIVVAKAGETCPNSGAGIQTSTARALTASGTSQADDIVLALDVGLLCAIIGLLVLIIWLIGASVAYCLHKAFDCKIPKVEGYRTHQKNHDLDFELLGEEETPEVVNQELCHYYPVEDEHDMETVSFNIHADIIKHSQDFLNLYDDALFFSEDRKRNETLMINELINEIDAMIKLIGDSAISGKMYYGPAREYDAVLKDINKDLASSDKSPILKKGAKGDLSSEDELKAALNREVLEKEEELRALIIRDDAQSKDERLLKREIMREMNLENPDEELIDEDGEGDDQTLSLQERIRKRIEKDDNIDQLNKDKMLFDHDKKLEGIEGELEKERARQEHALAQLLRAKADARRKKNALTGVEDNTQKELDKVKTEFAERLKDGYDDIDQEIYEHQVAFEKTKDPAEKEIIDQLKERKRQLAEELERERLRAAKEAMERLRRQGEMDEKEITAMIDRFIPRDSQEKLAMDQDFNQQVAYINQQKEFELEDLKRRQEEEMQVLEHNLDSASDDDTIEQFINTLSQRVIDQHLDADEEEKSKHLDRMNNLRKLLKENDNKLEKDLLLQGWNAKNKEMEDALRRGRDVTDAKLKQRLQERKKDRKRKMLEALRIAHEEEEAKLVLDQLGREHLRKSEINRDQICKIVKLLMKEMEKAKENGEDIPELTLNKIKQLFESMFAEVEMADFTNQLVKHFAEKEVMLKRLLARYTDIQRMEKASIKKHFANKLKDLEAKRDEIDEDEFDKLTKELLFQEENAIRDLNLDKLHKEEEAALMQSLEKKHAREAIQLKNDLLEEKIKATNELFRNQNKKAHEEEIRIYKKALWSFKAKKEKELERRLRAIEFSKMKMIHEIEREIQNKVKDYEELLRRRSEEEKFLKDRKEEMRQALIRHKELIKERMGNLGVADKEKIFEELDKNYKGLSHSIEQERKRMYLEMQRRDQKRRELSKNHLSDFYDQLGGDGFRNKVQFMDNHTYMGRLLNQWKTKNDEKAKLKAKIEETARLNYMYLKQPGALISELLRRVKNLELLLRNFDSDVIHKIMQEVGDLSLKARAKR